MKKDDSNEKKQLIASLLTDFCFIALAIWALLTKALSGWLMIAVISGIVVFIGLSCLTISKLMKQGKY